MGNIPEFEEISINSHARAGNDFFQINPDGQHEVAIGEEREQGYRAMSQIRDQMATDMWQDYQMYSGRNGAY